MKKSTIDMIYHTIATVFSELKFSTESFLFRKYANAAFTIIMINIYYIIRYL